MELRRIYSYFIIKPDEVKHFPETKSTIEQEMEHEASIRFLKLNISMKLLKNYIISILKKKILENHMNNI